MFIYTGMEFVLLRLTNLFVFFIVFLPGTQSWHDLTNTDYHCWPLSANAQNPTPFTSCPGIHIHWLEAPPDEIKENEGFNVSYEMIISDAFYTWAVHPSRDIFAATGITNDTVARDWCETTSCPQSSSDAYQDNCCIHHVNVHTCPLGDSDLVENGLCGPWIPASGNIFTHSEVMFGTASITDWNSYVAGLYNVGQVSLIAHFKLAGMHVALEKTIKVLPRTVCGNSACEDSDGEDCSTCPKDCGVCPLEGWKIGLIVTAVVIFLAIIVGILCYLQWQKYKLLWDESWIISYESLEEDNKRATWGSFVGSFVSMSNVTNNTDNTNMMQMALQKQLFIRTALVSGRTVAVKAVHKHQFSVSKVVRIEVKEVRAMDHQNLCKFIGACVEVPHVCILTEYCPKGSLSDVLLNEDIPLSWGFRFSFATDIARGMAYLHNHKIFHSRLKSNNCVVDDRWTVKISDYGLKRLREDDPDPENDKLIRMEYRRNRVYLSPEVKEGYSQPTAATDVYAFSVILVEIATRNGPHGDEDPETLDDNWKPPLPDISKTNDDNLCPSPEKYLKLISNCWDFYPHNRPTFDLARKSLYEMNPNKMSPVDMMMNMMEKYSKHLESLVAERTQDLVAEKQKTDRLLYSMLPRAVADELRIGRPVNAETYSECTIYFSDIVGFTTLSGGSTPIQVVALLNKLYICFDSVIDEYDVYKVETIGDAYMVVSGVPVVTPFHAKEITGMAIDLVRESQNFIIPHKPEEALKIRVGVHTGPVCAGVVGLKMPRYCLFGDTVNTASRMESNGEAYKIHASNTTYEALRPYGAFTFEERGTIPVKGKGDMKTWWVTGKVPQQDLVEKAKLSDSSGVSLVSRPDSLQASSPETNVTDLPGCIPEDIEDVDV